MTIVDQAIWIIERNSAAPLALPGIARACGVSRAHLANAFGTTTGRSLMRYVRGRRLSAAARRLADGARDILAVAIDSGYGSHEAFTRAFRDQFGHTPEQVRTRGTVDGLTLVEPLPLKAPSLTDLEPPRLVAEAGLRVVGLAEVCSFDSSLTIPAQWQRFMELYDAISARLERMPVGISEMADDDGEFRYVCGAEVTRFERTPDGLIELEIAPREYAVFEHRGHVSTIYDTYAAIWNQALPAMGRVVADAPIVERHNAAFDPGTGEGGLTLWIPLEADR
ncbi:MAG: AraC family transcriptional regulator [Vicinamibacteraceae bacterium]